MNDLTRCILMLVAAPLCSDATEVKGVWQGTLGETEIVACFNSDKSGSYYDLHTLLPIQLRFSQEGEWSEYSAADLNRGEDEPNGNQWSLSHVSDDRLDGSWSSPDQPQSLLIGLKRLTSDYRRSLPSVYSWNEEPPCGSDAYNERLEFLSPLQFGPMEQFEGKQFRRILAGNVETIELSGQGKGIAHVNAALRKELPSSKAELRWFFASRRDGLSGDGWAYESFTRAQPMYWSGNWISVRFRWVNPAAPIDDIIDQYRVWDMRSGREVDPWTWFGTRSYEGTSQRLAGYSEELPPELEFYLRELNHNSWLQEHEECKSAFNANYYLVPEHEGLHFLPLPGPCNPPDLLVPYSGLKPFLTKSGAAAVRRIIQDEGTLFQPQEKG